MLLKVDAAQLEWRVAVELSGDTVGYSEITERQDAHALNQVAFRLPSRLIAKIYLFRTIFRGTGYSFANDPNFMHVSTDPKYWDNVNELFYKKYFGLDNWHKAMAEDVLQGRSINTPFGREYVVLMRRDFRGNLKLPWTIFSNYPVQGTGADIMMLARLSMARRIKEQKIPAIFVATVHDDIKLDFPDEYKDQVVKICFEVFDDLPGNIHKIFGYKWKTRLDCEVFVGNDMLEMQEVKRKA